MTKYLTLLFIVSFFLGGSTLAQRTAVKTNALYWVTGTPNISVEVGFGKSWSLDVSGNYNPFQYSDNKSIKHWIVQPGLRYWLCKPFKGHFLGLHGQYAEYDVIRKKNQYSGNLYGAGVGYGYQLLLSPRWSVEAEIGLGYSLLKYDIFKSKESRVFIDSSSKNYVGITKIAVNFVYVIK